MSLVLHRSLRPDHAIATTGDGPWLRSRLGSHSHVGDIRGRGLFWALDFVEDRASRRGFNPDLRINDAALRRGIAIYPMGGTVDGTQGDHVIIAPPYIADAAAIDLIMDRLGDAVRDALGAG